MTRDRFSFKNPRLPGRLIITVIIAAMMLAGCQEGSSEGFFHAETPTAAPTEATVPAPTEPEPTAPPDGNPDDVTCKGSYNGGVMELSKAMNTTVATAGDKELTNGLLQIYYRMAVNNYRKTGNEIAPDFSQGLDTQIRDLDGTAMTWQQYFLQQALDTWQSHVAMTERSKNEILPLEEAYERNEQKHAENLKTRIYNLDVLYGYNAEYRIADAHQAYLDQLEEKISDLATAHGCKTPAALAKDLAGIGTNDTFLLDYAQLLNEGYMFMTSLSYYIEPTDAEIEAFFAAHESDYAAKGITKEGNYANLRHILLVPNGETQEDWAKCKEDADKLLDKWSKTATEANFADMAFANSADTGSSVNGGLYANLSKGQLTKELDDWCFNASRKAGDTAIIKTSAGYHIVYMSAPSPIWYVEAEKDLIADQLTRQISDTAAKYPLEVEYSAILLGTPDSEELVLAADDLLYPDIAHERFPVAPLYFQQDYPNTMYGAFPLVRYGCGVTTMSMLVSYMTDEEWTPPELCAQYGHYCGPKGTAHAMFTEVPIDKGFYCVERVFTWADALKAMEQGYMVVTLQRDGYWTNGGHYLLLHNLIETEDGTKVQVWDSNLFNYKKLKGHTTGYFDQGTIPPNSRCYWVYQKKVTNLDSCARCAEPTNESYVPTDMFAEDYLCSKCAVALNRRNAYLTGCAVRLIPVAEPLPEETLPLETTGEETAATETVFEFNEDDTAPAEDVDIPEEG